MTTFTLEYLADHLHFAPTLAAWHNRQWHYLDVNVSVQDRTRTLQTHGKRQVPTTVVALSDQTLLGSASLIAHDMDTRMNLTPWLASVFVAPEHRKQGIGSALVRRIVSEAKALGFSRLYLFTADREHFYTHLGWKVLERLDYRGYPQVVMSRQLSLDQE